MAALNCNRSHGYLLQRRYDDGQNHGQTAVISTDCGEGIEPVERARMGELFHGLIVTGGAFGAVIFGAFHLDRHSNRRRRRQPL
jgi:hypothetical protein